MVLCFAIVIGAVFLAWWLSRFLLGRSVAGGGQYLKIIDRVAVGRERYLLLVQLQEETYFLGVTEQTVVLLEKMPKDFSCVEQAEQVTFPVWLSRFRKGAGTEQESGGKD